MAFTRDFKEYLKTLDEKHPNGLKAYDPDSEELKRLQHLARQSERKPQRIPKKQKIPKNGKLIDKDAVDFEKIRRLRKEKKMPLYRMAMELDITADAYGRKERGKVSFREKEISIIADVLNLSEEELLLTSEEDEGGR